MKIGEFVYRSVRCSVGFVEGESSFRVWKGFRIRFVFFGKLTFVALGFGRLGFFVGKISCGCLV